MKDFYEKLLDILYDYADWLIMAVVIVVIVSTIGWRLDVLFEKNTGDSFNPNGIAQGDKDSDKIPDKGEIEDNSEKDPSQEEKDGQYEDQTDNNEGDQEGPDLDDSQVAETDPEDNENTGTSDENIRVVIPPGSLSTSIGNILTNEGLVNSSTEFVNRAVDLGLDRKLQSGTFNIPKNSSLDNIIKIVAKQI